MKTIKNDTRYIIKRVLIGVLVAILLFNARKCGVYAETTDIYFYGNNRTGSSPMFLSTQKPSTREYYEVCSSNLDNYNIHFWYYDNGRDYVNNCTIFMFKNPNNTNTYRIFATFYDTRLSGWNTLSNDYYFKIEYSPSMVQVPPNVRIIDGTTTINLANNNNFASNISYPTKYGYVEFDTSMLDGSLNPLYSVSTTNYSLYNDMFDNWEFFTSANKSVYFNNIDKNPQFPPSGYSELDLTGYQGAFFVPKNYNNMNCSEVGDLCNISFDFYYQNSVSGAYFPLDNQNLVTDLTDYLSSDEPTLESSYFPLMQILQENDFATAYRYYAYLIYNRTPATYDWRDAIQNPYGSSKVWYNSDLYDYYLVEDFSTYTNNICFLDITNAKMCVDIKNIPTFLDSLNDAQEWQEAVGESKNINFKYNNFVFDFLKIPFTFLRSIVNNTCTFFEIPIPILGGTITLNCLSDTFKNVLGVGYYFIVGLINFLLLYRVTIYNIHTFKESLDPDKTSMEVVDL